MSLTFAPEAFATLQVQGARSGLDAWTLLSALALVVAAIVVWVMRLRLPVLRHVPPRQRPFWAAFSLGFSFLALGAAYDVADRLGILPFNLPVAQAAPLASIVCWLAALVLMSKYVRIVMRAGPALDALIVVTASIALIERLTGAISALSQGAVGTGGSPISWQSLHLYGALALSAAIILARYLARGSLPASHAWAMGAMLVGLATGAEWWTDQGLLAPVIARLIAAELAIVAIYMAVSVPKREPRNLWAPSAPWIPIIGAAALLALTIGPGVASYLQPDIVVTPDAITPDASLGGKLILGVAILGLLLVLVRWGTAAIETERLRRERQRLTLQNEEYVRLAISDPLTHLFNKGYFSYRLKEEWERTRRRDQPLILIALDLDNFKQVNDRYGHSAGDELLADVGGVIRTTVRNVDCPCRIGGDEFMVILPQTDLDGAMLVAERLRVGVLRVLKKLNLSPLVSISCGVSGYPNTAHTPDELVEQADAALYEAKKAGKNRVVHWKPEPKAAEASE
jgi:diguanylate cyclase (GGDEF)-like protein